MSRLPETTGEEFNAAMQSSAEAFPGWKRTPVSTRARVMFKLQQLIRDNMVCLRSCNSVGSPSHRCALINCEVSLQDTLAANVSLEQGKTLADAKGDVFRGQGQHSRQGVMDSFLQQQTAV